MQNDNIIQLEVDLPKQVGSSEDDSLFTFGYSAFGTISVYAKNKEDAKQAAHELLSDILNAVPYMEEVSVDHDSVSLDFQAEESKNEEEQIEPSIHLSLPKEEQIQEYEGEITCDF